MKLCVYHIIFLLYITSKSIAQHPQNETFDYHEGIVLANDSLPQNKPNYDKIGSYEIIALSNKSEVNRGEEIEVYAYITGYGQIGSSKVDIIPSVNIFDTANSIMMASMDRFGPDMSMGWGVDTIPFTNGWLLSLTSGFSFRKGDSVYYSNYFDLSSNPRMLGIISESHWKNAPITLKLKIKEGVDPGDYKIGFYYTYYNGSEWASSTATIEFHVNSFFEEWSNWVTGITLMIGILSIIPVYDFFEKAYQKRFGKKPPVKKKVDASPIIINTEHNDSSRPTPSKKPRILRFFFRLLCSA